jgi:aminomethyltransferase
MVDFAGWSMPIQYSSIIDEHLATRKSIGMFDVSHMGRFAFYGDAIDIFLDRLTTRRVAGMEPGRIRYSLMTNELGGILDDVLVYYLPDKTGKPCFSMVVNASNRRRIFDWLQSQIEDRDSIVIEDRTEQTAMIACQGPNANSIVAEICEIEPDSLKYYAGTTSRVCGHQAVVSRTGYTGEDGCEIIVDNASAVEIWDEIHHRALAVRGLSCGLAARDTLRLEAAMPLYGHELELHINAAQTDLSFAINLRGRKFVGSDAILAAQKDSMLPRRIGLTIAGRRAARQGSEIQCNGSLVGQITSGTYAPTLQRSICMGYVQPQYAEVGKTLQIDIRGTLHDARVVPMPFYTRS